MTNDELLKLITLQRQVEFQYKLDNFTDNSLGQIKRSIDKARNQVVDYITDRGEALTSWGGKRSTDILNEMDKLTFGIRGQLVNDISDISSIAGEKALEMHGDILSFGGRVAKFNTTLLSAAQLKSMILNTPVGGNLLKDWVDRTFTTNLQESIKEDILAGMLRGKGYRGLINGVEEGFNNISRREAITLTRTYVQSANVGAMESVYRDNADIVKQVKWSATLEGGYSKSGRGTCIRCACLDGETYPIDDHPPCPLHPRCFIDGQTKIYTSRGWKQIRNIKVGNLVLTHKGRFRKVTELIFTPEQKPKVTKIFVRYNNEKRKEFITVTDDHPIMINGNWQSAKDAKIGDKISVLASRCKRCGKKIPYYRKYCSQSCNSKNITDRQWADPNHRELISRKASEQMKREYKDGTRDPFEITQACNKRTRELAKQGLHAFQRLDVIAKNKLVTNLPHHRKASSKRMKTNNPMSIPAIKAKQLVTYKQTIKEHPEKHINYILGQKGCLTKLESQFEPILKELGIDYIRQYPINGYYTDFAIVDKKIAIEIDETETHRWTKKRDRKRQNSIEDHNWIVLRFSEVRINNDYNGIKEELQRIFMNHDGEYDFIELEITNIESWKLKKARTLYNFSVEEDESYIAKGFVVHNCRCFLLPQTVSYKEIGLDMDEVRDVYRPYTIRPSETIDVGRRKQIIEVGFEKGSYADFYASRGKKFQSNVVGPVRQQLISDGDINFKDLVNLKTGRLLRLDELGYDLTGKIKKISK